jgi:NADPH:quinone reductase-like Zn-dependent oxidoreductase
MKAAVQRGFGGPEVVEVTDVPDPSAAPGDVVVAVHAAALNRLDVLQRRGPALLPGFELPHIAGMDIAGVVDEVGDGVTGVAVGDRVVVNPAVKCGSCPSCASGDDALCHAPQVIGGNRAGGFAERCAVPAANVHPVPDGVSLDEAATIPTAYSTAWRAIVGVADVQPGETVVVHAAASGVSTAAIQLAKRAGATVVATASSEAKLDVARKLGADVGVVNRDDSWVARVREATGGRGADVVFDHVGPALFQGSLDVLRPRGRLVFCGTTSGAEATFFLPGTYQRGLRLLGVESYSAAEFARMLEEYWSGGFVPVVDSTFPLAELGEAQERLESGRTAGKVLIHPATGDPNP